MARNLKIRNKTSDIVPLIPNDGQLRLWAAMQLQMQRDLPVRIIVVKARQRGVSTFAAGLFFTLLNHTPNLLAQVISDDLDASALLFTMTKLFQSELDKDLQRPTDYSNKKEITYSAPHRSKFMVLTAGKDVLGRGGTVQYIHASEVAFWPNAKDGLGASLQQVPKAGNTMVILESTGNGVGGEFYDRYVQAVEALKADPDDYRGFLPVFLPWNEDKEYAIDLRGRKLEYYHDHEIFGDEVSIVERFNLTPEQVYWRRNTIKDECGGDLQYFMQEYPMTWQESFQASGQSVFSQTMLNKLEPRCTPGRFCEITDAPVDVLRQSNCWQIWELPDPASQYTLGIDTAEGILSDKANVRSKRDYHGAVIYNRTKNTVAAAYHGRQADQHELGSQCLNAARFYNNAWAAPELPMGMVVLDVFKQAAYPNIFRRQAGDDKPEAEEGELLGWKTTTATRPLMVEGAVSFCRESPPTIYSADLIREMRTFVRDKTGRPVHLPGEHDDMLFAFMIALQLHLRCPMKAVPYPYSSTIEGPPAVPVATSSSDLARIGVIDPGVCELEDDDDYFQY